MFEIVYDDDDDDDDGRRTTDDGRRLDGYTISSPCEPNGSGELTKRPNLRAFRQKHANGIANSEDPDQTAPLGAV